MSLNICVHSALVPDPRVENTPCILDTDMFHLLVGKQTVLLLHLLIHINTISKNLWTCIVRFVKLTNWQHTTYLVHNSNYSGPLFWNDLWPQLMCVTGELGAVPSSSFLPGFLRAERRHCTTALPASRHSCSHSPDPLNLRTRSEPHPFPSQAATCSQRRHKWFCWLLCAIRGGADGAGEWGSREGRGGESVYALQHTQDASGKVKVLPHLPATLWLILIYIVCCAISQWNQKKQTQNKHIQKSRCFALLVVFSLLCTIWCLCFLWELRYFCTMKWHFG